MEAKRCVVRVSSARLLLLSLEYIHRLLVCDVAENRFRIKHFRINLLWGFIALADNENLRGDVTGRAGFVRLDLRIATPQSAGMAVAWQHTNTQTAEESATRYLGEELIEDPEKVVVVLGPEDLGDVPAARAKDLAGEPQTREHQLGLNEGFL